MGASILSVLLLLSGSVTDWTIEKIEDTRSVKKAPPHPHAQRNAPFKSEESYTDLDTCGASQAKGGRIVGGWNATEGEFPWQVSIQQRKTRDHFCGGSIIEPDIVVTAAHCVDGNDPWYLLVQAGILDLRNSTDYTQLRDVEQIVVHESFEIADYSNDIALLKLTVPFDFATSSERIGTICLPAKDRPLKGHVTVTGWGYTLHDGLLSPQLRAVSVPVKTSTPICDTASLFRYDPTTQFCAGSLEKDACKGDSGGTALQKEGDSSVLVGVISFGENCGVDPGIYVRVTAYTDWIRENIVKLRSSAPNLSPR
ncbi:transmembrane protease serine 2-like [Ixodes scapularis]